MTNAERIEDAAAMAEQGSPKKQKPAKAKTRPAARKTKPKKISKPAARRGETKAGRILSLLGRAKGATLVELMKATGWQAHSVRGFLSTARKRHGIPIASAKNESGTRVYRAAN